MINLNIIYEPRNISGKIQRLIFEGNDLSYFFLLVVPSGTVFRLSGRMLHISFLDQKGVLIPSPSEKWETKSTLKLALISRLIGFVENKSSRMNDGIQDFNPPSVLPGSGTSSPATTSPPPSSIQYAVFCSSKEARVSSTNSFLRKSFSLALGHCLTSPSVSIQTKNLRITRYICLKYHSCIRGEDWR